MQLLRQWGNSTADAALDMACKHFVHPEVEGFIPYRVEAGCAVVFGDPVCASEQMPGLVAAFHSFCRQNKNNVIYLIASERFAMWAIQNTCSSMIEFGHELFLNPHKDRPEAGHQGALLRKKIRRAAKEGLLMHEHMQIDPEAEDIINKTAEGVAALAHGAASLHCEFGAFSRPFWA